MSLLTAAGLHFYVLPVGITRNETNEDDIGRRGMEKVRNAYKILVGNPERKSLRGRTRSFAREDIILELT